MVVRRMLGTAFSICYVLCLYGMGSVTRHVCGSPTGHGMILF